MGAFAGEVTNFLNEKAREIDTAKATADGIEANAAALEARAKNLRSKAVDAPYEAITIEEKWGPGGTYRQVVSAFTAAASGNVSSVGSDLVQRTVVNWTQSVVAHEIKQLAEDYGIAEGTPAHAALHALSSCVGASAGGADCATSAIAGASTTFVSALLAAQDDGTLTSEQKEARQALVQSLITGAAVAAGADAEAANTAALIELENNSNIVRAVKEAAEKAQALLTKSGKDGLEKLGKVLEKFEVKTLVDKKEAIKKYLEEAGARGGLKTPNKTL